MNEKKTKRNYGLSMLLFCFTDVANLVAIFLAKLTLGVV